MLSIKSYGTSICSVPWFCSEDVLKLFKGTDEFLQRAQTWASDNITIHDDDGDDDDGDDGDGVGVVGGDDHSDYDDGDDEYYINSDNIFLGNLLRITSWIPRSTISTGLAQWQLSGASKIAGLMVQSLNGGS